MNVCILFIYFSKQIYRYLKYKVYFAKKTVPVDTSKAAELL